MNIEEIRRRKQEKGYTTEQLAGLAGIPVGTLQKILNGYTKSPRYATLQALERVLRPAISDELHEPAAIYRTRNSENGVKQPESRQVEVNVSGNKMPKEKLPGEYTIGDYYALPDEQRAELIDGVFYDMSAPTAVHQAMVGELYYQIESFLRKNQGPCKVSLSPTDVRLDEDDRTMVQPDLLIVCDPSKIRRWGIFGAPDFAAEIVSKSSSFRDYIIKASKYMRAGVREYWILDPNQKRVIVYRQSAAGEDFTPYMGSLSGKLGVGIYNGELVIDLDAMAALIQNYPE